MKNLIITIVCLLLFQSMEAQSWQVLSAGTEFSMALKTDGTIWSWGFNGNGQLGIDSNVPSISLPEQVGNINTWKDVAAGGFHCLALKNDGTLWSWGLNGTGQLGIGNLIQQNAPIQVGNDDVWVYIEAGQATSFAIKQDGTLWGWGFNSFGQIGNNSTIDINEPVQVGTDNDWWMVKSGGAHTIGLKADSTLWAWGANFNGQLGTGDIVSYMIPTSVDDNNDWTDIDAGFEFSLGIRHNESLWSWGFNGNGQLGNGTTSEVHSPIQVANTINFKSVSAGSVYGVAINENQELFSWGANIYGELGLGNTSQQNNVTQVGTDNDWETISAAEGGTTTGIFGFHNLGLRNSEENICVTGANYIGQLGNGTTIDESIFSCNVGAGTVDVPLILVENEEIQFFPNPVNGNQFSIIQTNEKSLFTLSDLTGNIWVTKNLSAKRQVIECNDLPPGVYIITVRGNDWMFSGKLFKL